MVRMQYVGVANPRGEMEKLRPARDLVITLMTKYPPTSEEYKALLAIASAILAAGHRFVPEDPYLFALKPPRS